MSLGEKIKRARQRLGLSQEELAQTLMVDRKSVINWEHGYTRPSRALLRALEQVVGPLDGVPEDLFTLADTVRNSAELTAGQKQALLGMLDGRPHGRHSLIPTLGEP